MFSNILITIHNNYSGAEDHHTLFFGVLDCELTKLASLKWLFCCR